MQTRTPSGNGKPRNCADRDHLAALLEAAKIYARRGWCIIPTREKKAAGKWKQFQRTRPDETTLRHLFSKPGLTGLAVILGTASGGLACRDFDDLDSYERWANDHGNLATALPTVETARGRHIYFRGPEGYQVCGNGEYRASAGVYCLLPPSLHPTGHVYRWLIPLPNGQLPAIEPSAEGLIPPATQRDTEQYRGHREPLTPHLPLEFSAPLCALCVADTIQATLPSGPGQRRKKIFALCRKLKATPDLANADVSTLRPILVEWHRQALPFIRTKGFTDSWADFLQAWPKVKFPAGQGLVETAFQRALASKPPPKAAALYTEAPVLLLASICRELQLIAGTAPFYLDCRTAGRLVRVHHTTAWRLLTIVFVADRILTAGAKGSKARAKANEYRYIGDN